MSLMMCGGSAELSFAQGEPGSDIPQPTIPPPQPPPPNPGEPAQPGQPADPTAPTTDDPGADGTDRTAPGEADLSPKTADDWPISVRKRPLTLYRGMFEISGDTIGVTLSKDAVGKPIFVAPDLHYGISNELTVGLVHQIGLCVSEGCDGYNDLGFEAKYLVREFGDHEVAARGRLLFSSLSDPFAAGLSVAGVAKFRFETVALVVEPGLYFGLAGRDFIDDEAEIPLTVQYEMNEEVAIFFVTGVTGIEFGSDSGDFRVPVGVGANLSVSRRIDVGGELRFDNIAGSTPGKLDQRFLLLRAAFRI